MGTESVDLKPVILDPRMESFEDFGKRFAIDRVIDNYGTLIEELFLIRNPEYRFNRDYQRELNAFLKEHLDGKALEETGSWFYFPWSKSLIHYLPHKMHQELRTARNRNIITSSEQKKFYDFNVGIVGLSVGSHAALTLAMMGAGKVMKLADPDKISGSNLNRIRQDFSAVGRNKCELAVEQLYQMNPYADIRSYPEGITEKNMLEFLSGPPRLDILVEESDNLALKIRLRIEARKLGIPVVMATDNGDNVIVDIERYDLDANLPIFNGLIGDLTPEALEKMNPEELPKLATRIAGPDFVVPRMFESLNEVGKTLYSWPQLGSAATLSGVAVAYAVKRIALNENIKSGKMEINLDSIFDPDYRTHEAVRVEKRRGFLSKFGVPG